MTDSATPLADAPIGRRGPSFLVVIGAAAILGVLGGLVIALVVHRSGASRAGSSGEALGGPAASWPAGARLAPEFHLTDQDGRPISLGSLRGRPVIVSFIDPVCRNLCPLGSQCRGLMACRSSISPAASS